MHLESKRDPEDYLSLLNEQQREAVLHVDGPLLVLAGAGTGKTRVLISRISHILDQQLAEQDEVLAVTFTNKAANEIKERLSAIVGPIGKMWIGTFHSVAMRILRKHCDIVGLDPGFIILDAADQQAVMKQVLLELNIDTKKYSPKYINHLVSRMKDKGYLYTDTIPAEEDYEIAHVPISSIYRAYQETIMKSNSIDFGDILLYCIVLFNRSSALCSVYQQQFKYIMIDEYQDTNVVQYRLMRILSARHKNICCVGDDDQSIYGWRGAEINNILRFDQDFPDARIIQLEYNYRSTNNILQAASHLISHNRKRHGKSLWTDTSESDEKVKVGTFFNDKAEARGIAEEIFNIKGHDIVYSEVAVLIRAGYQSRALEESFNLLRIPYKIVGGIKFYERAEIRDTIAYIRLVLNINDNIALERIINTPKRGIGKTTINKVRDIANKEGISSIEAAEKVLSGKAKIALLSLLESVKKSADSLASMKHWEVIDILLEEVGYYMMLESSEAEDKKARRDNIKEVLRNMSEYDSLPEYMEHVSLLQDSDNVSYDQKVNIMTMHTAKGLEFGYVFLPGWEEGVFPSQQSIDESDKSSIEEERRLAYVGMTRSKNKLYISCARSRNIFGSYQESTPSRFLSELPSSCCTFWYN